MVTSTAKTKVLLKQAEAAESTVSADKPAAMEAVELDILMRKEIRNHMKITGADGQVTTLYVGYTIDENGEFHFR